MTNRQATNKRLAASTSTSHWSMRQIPVPRAFDSAREECAPDGPFFEHLVTCWFTTARTWSSLGMESKQLGVYSKKGTDKGGRQGDEPLYQGAICPSPEKKVDLSKIRHNTTKMASEFFYPSRNGEVWTIGESRILTYISIWENYTITLWWVHARALDAFPGPLLYRKSS